MKRLLLYYSFLCKRFFKRMSFLLLLCAVPLAALGLKAVSRQDSGILTIALYMINPEDALAQKVVQDLMTEDSVLKYSLVKNEEEAYDLVCDGRVDAAWIFDADFQELVSEYTAGEILEKSPVLVVEAEETVPLRLSRIKLFGAMYPYLAYSLYENFVQVELIPEETISAEELKEIYELTDVEGSLFRLDSYDTAVKQESSDQRSYITAPLRGLLALLLILAGFAADMFFLQDEENGVLDSVSVADRQRLVYVYQLAAMVPVSVVVLLALRFGGEFTGTGRELVLMLLYLGDCMVFCRLIQKVCGTAGRLGTALPVLMLGMLILCPVFFNMRKFRIVQYFLPPAYYLYAVSAADGEIGRMCSMLLYGLAVAGMERLLRRFPVSH